MSEENSNYISESDFYKNVHKYLSSKKTEEKKKKKKTTEVYLSRIKKGG